MRPTTGRKRRERQASQGTTRAIQRGCVLVWSSVCRALCREAEKGRRWTLSTKATLRGSLKNESRAMKANDAADEKKRPLALSRARKYSKLTKCV